MNTRFRDSAAAYRLHRSVTNEAEAISATLGQYVANELGLVRSHLRLLDAGTGDGRVLKGTLERLLQAHDGRPCELALKEVDFHHIEALLQNVAPMLRRWPQLALFVTNRTFRQLQGFADDLRRENIVCFDDVAGYRLLAMTGTSSLLTQQDSLLHTIPDVKKGRPHGDGMISSWMPVNQLWDAEQTLFLSDSAVIGGPRLKALGDEIRAREIYDELAAAGTQGKHFTVTVTRQENAGADFIRPREFFWDLAIVSHAFNRDKDPGWICRNILGPLCEGLSIGGVLVNVHAVDGGSVSEIRREIFGERFLYQAPAGALAAAWEAALDNGRFQLLPCQEFLYHGHMTAEVFSGLEPWEREMALQQMAVSVTYHLQIPDAAWLSESVALKAKIQQVLEREGSLVYSLNIVGAKRRE